MSTAPTREQLEAIAALYPGSEWSRLKFALTPFGRDHLVLPYFAARSAHIEALGRVHDVEMAQWRNAVSHPGEPPLPLDAAAHQAACIQRDHAAEVQRVAWAKIQRIVDRAQQLLHG